MKQNLIIIDDDLPFRNRLSQSMQKKGFNVESFGDDKNSIESKDCTSETSCTEYAYSVLANVPQKKCQELAPHFKGKCQQSYLIAVGDYSGGSMGWDYGYNIYGLFLLKDKRRFIVPLKNFQNKNDAINYIEQSVR